MFLSGRARLYGLARAASYISGQGLGSSALHHITENCPSLSAHEVQDNNITIFYCSNLLMLNSYTRPLAPGLPPQPGVHHFVLSGVVTAVNIWEARPSLQGPAAYVG